MMLRIIFTGLATCMLLLAAGVRFAREDAPPEVRKALDSGLERAIENAKEALRRPPAEAPAASAAASPTPPQPASKPTLAPEPVPAQTPEPATARTPEPAISEAESVTEEWISPLWSAPFAETTEAGGEGEEVSEQQAPLLAAAPSQDKWAGLIRRMLAIYERVSAAR